VLIYGCYALRSVRWQVFQRNLGRAKFWEIYSSTARGFCGGLFIGSCRRADPASSAGAKSQASDGGYFGIWVLERLFDIASMAIIAAVALLMFNQSAHSGDAANTIAKAARTTGTFSWPSVSAELPPF